MLDYVSRKQFLENKHEVGYSTIVDTPHAINSAVTMKCYFNQFRWPAATDGRTDSRILNLALALPTCFSTYTRLFQVPQTRTFSNCFYKFNTLSSNSVKASRYKWQWDFTARSSIMPLHMS